MYLKEFSKRSLSCDYSDLRAESEEIKQDILSKNITHVLCCMGRTHGSINNIDYTTIDYLENKETLPINLNDNLYSPISLALFCEKNNIHFTYIGTGCIYEYDDKHTIYNGVGFTEDDAPNFFGSNYSIVKGYTNNLMKQTNALHLRIRMPITSEENIRNFITKITTYEKICSVKNSMTVLDELIPISIDMMLNNERGTFNFTNPGNISHNEILQLYTLIVDYDFTWKNFTTEEQDKILLGKRSNNLLDTTKLEENYKILNIRDSVKKCLHEIVSKKTNIKMVINSDNSLKDTTLLLKEFIIKDGEKIKDSGELIKLSDKNDKVAVIVLKENTEFPEAVIRNVMHNLGDEWNLHIFGDDLEYVKKCLPQCSYSFTSISKQISVKEYNTLLKNVDFWKSIKEEHILIFQNNNFILNNKINLDKYLDYSFIGGVYKSYILNNTQVLVGKIRGFSN